MNKPTIRFKGFQGEWKERKFGDFGHVEMCKRIFKYQTSSQGEIPFYKIGTFGFQPDAFISRSLYEDYRKKFSYPKKGDILISAAGTIGRTIEYKGEECYYQDSNIVWLSHNEEIDNAYLKQLYSLVTWSSLEGATIKRLYNSNILNTHFNLPSLSEQRALASYFTSLDAQIAASTSRLSSIKQVKAASLLNMFPQKGETVPRVRFKGFEGEWKEKALGDVVDDFKYGINAAAVSYDGENKYLRITDIDEESRAFIKDELTSPDVDLSSRNEYIMQEGDIVIARTGASVGKSYIYHPIDGKVYFAGFLIRARVNKKVDREFVYLNTLTDGFKKYIRFVSQRSGQPGVNAEELKSYLMNLPASLPEQRAIASYFTALDAQITLHRERLEKLKQIKAACLEKMFA